MLIEKNGNRLKAIIGIAIGNPCLMGAESSPIAYLKEKRKKWEWLMFIVETKVLTQKYIMNKPRR